VKGGDRESARRSARRALKLEPKNLAAVRAMAEVFRQEKYPDKGLELLKGVEIPETDLEAQTQLASLYIAASERAPSTAAMLDFAGSAADTIHRMAVRRAASLPATASNSERGDAQFAIGNWQDAISAYQKDGPPDTAPVSTLNRLVLAYWRAGREKEAGSLLRALARYRRQDDVTRALVALETLRQYKPARARELAEAAAEDGSPAAMMVSAYANLVLNRRAEVRQWVERAKESLGESTDILLLDSLSAQDPVQSKTAVMKAIASGPGLAEGYAILGYQTMLARDAKRFEASDLLFEFAVRRDPKCGYALLGFALSLISQKRANEADTILRQLDAVEGPGPATYYTKAVHLTRQDKASIQITDYLKAAKRMDEDRWSDVFVPDLSNLIARVFQYRMPLYLTPASLYPKAAS
jgi:tetratricopeptide (TPR) repeat protein